MIVQKPPFLANFQRGTSLLFLQNSPFFRLCAHSPANTDKISAPVSSTDAWNLQAQGWQNPCKMELQEESVCVYLQNLQRVIQSVRFQNLRIWKNHDLEKTVNFEEKVKGYPFGNLPKMEVFGQSNIRVNMARKQPSVIPLWFPHFSLKSNIFYHYLLWGKRNRWKIITKFMDFFFF